LILIVDDNEVLRKLLSRQLSEIGYASQYAATGKEAVELCLQRNFHLIIMDIQMPQMDGLAASKQIRRDEELKGKTRVPIIALSAQAKLNDCLSAGIDDLVSKPLLTNKIQELVRTWILSRSETPDVIASILPVILKRHRLQCALTVQELARRSAVSVEQLAGIEAGTEEITIESLISLAVGMDISVSELLSSAETVLAKLARNGGTIVPLHRIFD